MVAGGAQDSESRAISSATAIVAVDDSEQSMVACEWACKHLNKSGHRFILLHVRPLLSFSAGPAYIVSREAMRLMEIDAQRRADKVVKKALAICNVQKVANAETHVGEGQPKHMICKCVKNFGANVLVTGTRAQGLLVRAIKGSVSGYCTKNAECPVVVVSSSKASS